MAQNYATRPVTRLSEHSSSVSDTTAKASMLALPELMKLPISELKSRLEQDGVKSEELRVFCKYLGLPQTGSKSVMIAKILEKLSGEEDDIRKSPEGRAGRERALRPGAAAAALRAEAAKHHSQHSDLEDDHFADLQKAPPLPGGAFIGTPIRSKFASSNQNTPLAELRHRAATIRAALEAAVPKPPSVPCGLDGRDLELAEEEAQAYEPTGRDIMNVLGQIAKNMVVKDDLRAEVTEALLPVYANLDSINAKSERALDETKVLNERLTAIEQKTSSEVDRVARLEAKLSNLKLGSHQSSGESTKTTRIIAAFHSRASLLKVWIPDSKLPSNWWRNSKARTRLFALTLV